MSIHFLALSTIAYIVQRQPTLTLDCSDAEVHIHHATQGKTIRIQSIQLRLDPDIQELKLVCTPYDQTLPIRPIDLFQVETIDHCFHLATENPSSSHILQAVPTTLLFPENNSLGVQKVVAVDPPYVCTMEETHQLLQLHLPDLDPNLLKRYPLPIKVAHSLEWPLPKVKPTYYRLYSLATLDSIPENQSWRIPTASTPVNRPLSEKALYLLRNTLVLWAIMPALRSLCAWRVEDSDHFYPQLLQELPLWREHSGDTQILAYPSLSATDNITGLSGLPYLSVAACMPAEQRQPPATPDPSPAETANQIQRAIQQAQNAMFQC